jgi:CBS domain-containing protein
MLPKVSPNRTGGFVETLAAPAHGGHAALPDIARPLALDINDLFPIAKALHILEFAEPKDGVINPTALVSLAEPESPSHTATPRCQHENVLPPAQGLIMRKMSDIVRNQDPVTLPPSATVREACRYMRDRRVGAVLVTEGDHRLLGIFTGRDAVHRVLAEGRSAARTKLAEVMTRDPHTMPPGKTAIEALRLMEDGRYRHMPVVDGGRVVGIVSRFDFSGIELDRLDEETGLWEKI